MGLINFSNILKVGAVGGIVYALNKSGVINLESFASKISELISGGVNDITKSFSPSSYDEAMENIEKQEELNRTLNDDDEKADASATSEYTQEMSDEIGGNLSEELSSNGISMKDGGDASEHLEEMWSDAYKKAEGNQEKQAEIFKIEIANDKNLTIDNEALSKADLKDSGIEEIENLPQSLSNVKSESKVSKETSEITARTREAGTKDTMDQVTSVGKNGAATPNTTQVAKDAVKSAGIELG